jgi:predicted Zn-dependent peptidase
VIAGLIVVLASCGVGRSQGAMPWPARTTLPSGLRLWSFPSDGDRFELVVFVEAGSRDEERGRTGLAHLVEHCAFRSTTRRASQQVLDTLRDLGSEENAETTADYTAYRFDVPPADAADLIDLVAEMIARPAFADADVAREVAIVLEELGSRGNDLPPLTLEGELYPDNALGRSVGGAPAEVKRLDAGDVAAFHASHYRAGNIIVAWAGAADEEAVRGRIEAAFARLPPGRADRRLEKPQPRSGIRVVSGAAPRAGDGNLLVGHHASRREAERLAAWLVVEELLQHEVFRTVRTEEGLAYAPHVAFVAHPDAWRLDVFAHVADGRKLPALVDAFDAAFLAAARPDEHAVTAAVAHVVDRLAVTDGPTLLEATRWTWLLEQAGARDPDLPRLLSSLDARAVTAVTGEAFVASSRFLISDDPALAPAPWLLLGVMGGVGLTAVLAWKLQPWVQRLRLRARVRSSAGMEIDVDERALRELDDEVDRVFREGRRRPPGGDR